MRTLKNFKAQKLILLLLIPSLAGMMVFYFIPALSSLFNAFTNHHGDFVWFTNFIDVLTSGAFRLATQNTLRFILISVPVNIVLAYVLAGFCQGLKHKKIFAVIFMIPLIIPSGAIVYFWHILFAENGIINRILFQHGFDTTIWFSSPAAFWITMLVFIFKNIGFNLVLFLAGFQLIPTEYYEVAEINGAGTFQKFRHVTFVYMLPTTLLVLIMSIINSFKIFREIYLLFGRYPHPSTYMLQHFMNNQFAAANLQRLSVSAVMLSLAVFVLVLGVFKGTHKLTDIYD
ncbi:MAG: sugar ABC transporter permease [Oscillospiraceae bacterium]|nr:sugar ABC transporter permease [Oscillospiraceae bacterium]MCL2279609.1 sugar ABC transporter permease [Oscillospiraceae bacterium]